MPEIYALKHVLFCDILGFSRAVLCQRIDPARFLIAFSNFKATAEEANRNIDSDAISPTVGRQYEYVVSPRAEHFSDCIVITTPPTNVDAIWLCHAAADIQNMLVKQGFLSRGAICTGLLHHAETSIFGPAFVEAVQREKSTSMPRIAVSAETLRHFRTANNPQDQEISSARERQLLISDQSEDAWIDPFHHLKFFAQLSGPPPHPNVAAEVAAWARAIRQGLLNDEPHIAKKYVWMSRQFNERLVQPGGWIQSIEVAD